MSFSWRQLLLAAVVFTTSCVGGPVSDLPNAGDNGGPGRGPDGDDDPSSGGGLDAGLSAPLDAGAPGGESEDAHVGIPCDDAGAPRDGG